MEQGLWCIVRLVLERIFFLIFLLFLMLFCKIITNLVAVTPAQKPSKTEGKESLPVYEACLAALFLVVSFLLP